MTRTKKTLTDALMKHVKSREELEILEKDHLFCQACAQNLRINRSNIKSSIEAHCSTAKHQKNLKLWRGVKTRQLAIDTAITTIRNPFFLDCAKLFTALNVPFTRANNADWKAFTLKWCGKTSPEASTLRKNYLGEICKEKMDLIRATIGQNPIYLEVDESSDFQQRPLVSIMIGALDGRASKSFLFDLVRLDKAANGVQIIQLVSKSLLKLWENDIHYDRVRLLVSDQASYMLTAGRDMKASLYPKMLHVTCLAHALHNVCLLAISMYKRVDRLVISVKRVFSKSARRRNEIRDQFDVPLPKLPVKTRWGTWIEFSIFLFIYYEDVKRYIATISAEDNLGISESLMLMHDPATMDELITLNELSFLPASIKRLEAHGLTIDEQKSIIDSAMERLKDPFKAKLMSLLANNPSYVDIFGLKDLEDRRIFKYAPLVSVDVERSFSSIRLIDSDRRQHFTAEHLKQHAIAYFNRTDRIEESHDE